MRRSDEPAEPQPKLSQVVGVLRERRPAPALSGHIDRMWTNVLSGPARVEVVPDGCIDIYWTGARLLIAGPNTRIVTVEFMSAANLVGARFNPGIAHRWLGISAVELTDTQPPLEDIWGRHATMPLADKLADAGSTAAAATILERSLLDRLPRVAPSDPMIAATVAASAKKGSGANGGVRGLIDDFGWSERTLRRRCNEAFGYGPKTLERILRFQRFLALLSGRPASLADLAIEAGYADQAHLAREVRTLSGRSPSTLMAEVLVSAPVR
jgi:AraC-like DNA-binding protein